MTLRPLRRWLTAAVLAPALTAAHARPAIPVLVHQPAQQSMTATLQLPGQLLPEVDLHQQQIDIATPLITLVGRAESDPVGGYDAANNGYPLDLGSDGIRKVFGRPAAEVTVGELLLAQSQRRIHAVGRYQIIGITLQLLVRERCITGAELFTDRVQDRAFLCLIQAKRPAVWHFITTGRGLIAAADAMAMEWASMPYKHGGSFYSNGRDRAHASRSELFAALKSVRTLWLGNTASQAEDIS